jgi:hypothetical protein
MILPANYYYAEYDTSLKVHVVPKDTKNEINMSLCGITNMKITKADKTPDEKYMCKRCLYSLWVLKKMWRLQLQDNT